MYEIWKKLGDECLRVSTKEDRQMDGQTNVGGALKKSEGCCNDVTLIHLIKCMVISLLIACCDPLKNSGHTIKHESVV